uniref:Uncharacterized protein n=1 Tax=viral metagenome TaxID=1070528 RepID=A0A6C0FD81_9ZZZZ
MVDETIKTELETIKTENIELKVENAQLKMKITMLEQMIQLLNNHNSKTDENLKLSIQAPNMSKTSNSGVKQVVLTKKFDETLDANIQDMNEKEITSILEVEPSWTKNSVPVTLLEIFDKALRGPHNEGSHLVQMTTKTHAKYLDNNGEVRTENINFICDIICQKLYGKCSNINIELSKILTENDVIISDIELNKSENRYKNVMALRELKYKRPLIKEITSMFQ